MIIPASNEFLIIGYRAFKSIKHCGLLIKKTSDHKYWIVKCHCGYYKLWIVPKVSKWSEKKMIKKMGCKTVKINGE